MSYSAIYQFNQFMNFIKLIPLVEVGRIGVVVKTICELLDKYFFELNQKAEYALKQQYGLTLANYDGIASNADCLCKILIHKFIGLCESKLYADQILSLRDRLNLLNEYIASLK